MVERPLRQIAEEILADWTTIEKSGADECARAMLKLNSLKEMYYGDTAVEVVARFLGHAGTWRGQTARRVKEELRTMLKRRDVPPNIFV